jgi:GNAT superfamily N-acetyltransferase
MRDPSLQLPIPPITAKGTGIGRQTANGQGLQRQAAVVSPIRSLGPNHRERIKFHLQELDQFDRYLRFGYVATDVQIEAYAAGLDLERDDVFGIYNRKLELIAMAHVAFPAVHSSVACTEFGVSVLKSARGRGHAARLFERAAIHTRNLGFSQIMIHALSENAAMLHIARSAGAVITRDGSDSEAYLRLPPATLDSRITEIVEEQWAQADYRYKRHGVQLRTFLAGRKQGECPKTPQTSDDA